MHSRARAADTPWDEPTPSSPEFSAFLDGSILTQDPWRRLGSPKSSAIAQLVLAMLTVDPARRPRLKEIERMEWYLQCVASAPSDSLLLRLPYGPPSWSERLN